MTTERNRFEILSILDRRVGPLTSGEISKELDRLGISITERGVRHYLKGLDKEGFTKNLGKHGRKITDAGREELRKGYVGARTDFIYDKVREIISENRFNLEEETGDVIVNLSLILKKYEKRALKIIMEICKNSNLAPPFIKVVKGGETVGNQEIPKGKIGIVTLSSVTIDEIILNHGIYVNPYAGAIVELKDEKPIRCTGFYSYFGVSDDPFPLFIAGRVTSPYEAAIKKNGEVPMDYREVPNRLRGRIIEILTDTIGIFGGLIIISRPGSPSLGIKSKDGYVGIFATGGELLPSALSECNITSDTTTAAMGMDFGELQQISDVRGRVLVL